MIYSLGCVDLKPCRYVLARSCYDDKTRESCCETCKHHETKYPGEKF